VIEVIVKSYRPETKLAGYCFKGKVVVIEKIVRAIVETALCEMKTLGFVPVWRKGVYHDNVIIILKKSWFESITMGLLIVPWTNNLGCLSLGSSSYHFPAALSPSIGHVGLYLFFLRIFFLRTVFTI